MSGAHDPAVHVRDLVVRYGALTAVDGVSFQAPAGRITALLGPNGAGKSTTVGVLCGLLRSDAGGVRILGLDPRTQGAALRGRVGVMTQQPGIHTGLRPLEVVELHAAYHNNPLDPVLLLDEVGLTDRARVSVRNLSGGEQQRLSLALALVGRPEVAILDEPTAGIDAQGRQVIRSKISSLRDEGVTVLVATHDLQEAERLSDHVVIVDRGRVVAAGSPQELMRSDAGSEVRFGAPPGLDVAALSAVLDAPVYEEEPGEYVLRAEATPTTVAALTAWLAEHDLPLADLRAGRQRLEDIFLRLTTQDGDAEQTGADVAPAGVDTTSARRGRAASKRQRHQR